MKSYLDQWLHDVVGRQPAPMNATGVVEGIRDKPLGPRSDYARIIGDYEPASEFEAHCTAANRPELEADKYLDGAVLGLLDVLLTAEADPLRNVRLTIIEAETHPIHSSQMAFRWAGRDAAAKLLEAIKPKPRNTLPPTPNSPPSAPRG
ncbi:MAG: hypothetical protein EOP86_21535 [Verrucomicrobiaceae bacterium]|nr:MAG: hypothetical protein EOP86_21535 [Verrucomicrobiaceae bacterium]